MAHGGVDVQGASGMELEAARAAIDQLARDIITGEVSAPLTEQNGTPITDEDGNVLMATRRLVTQAMLDRLAAELLAETGQMFQSLPKTLTADKLLMPDKVTTIARFFQYFSNRNLFDNWYFVDPVNQQEQAEYTFSSGTPYGIDRWKYCRCTVTLTDNGLLITPTNSENHTAWIGQALEDDSLVHKDVTLSMLTADGDLLTVSGIFPAEGEPVLSSGYVNDKMVYIEYVAGYPHPAALLWTRNNLPMTVIAAKLEPGLVQTLAHKNAAGEWVLNDQAPDKTLELLKCQRHFYRINNNTDAPLIIATGMKTLTGQVAVPFTIPSRMRTIPAIHIDDVSAMEVVQQIGSIVNPTNAHVSAMMGNIVRVNLSGDFSGMEYSTASVALGHYGYIDFDANL